MELSSARDAFDRVAKKQKLSSSKSQEVIDQVSHEIELALEKIQSVDHLIPPDDQKAILRQLKHKLDTMSPLIQLEGPQKDVNGTLAKYPKLLDKSLNAGISKAYRSVDFDFHIVNQIIACHFYRQGLFDLGDCLIREAGKPEAISLKSQFMELGKILDAIKARNIEPALIWVSKNLEKLRQFGSKLDLKLHSMQFMEILKGGGRVDTLNALNYAKTHLSPLSGVYMKEFQKITVCLLWSGKLERYPYSELLGLTHWEGLGDELSRDFHKLLGQSYNRDPLCVTIAAGIEGLPTLLKLANVMSAKKQEWQALKQLPVPVDLPEEFQFHSIFVCPVSRDQSSEENPPMLMPCMHVLCKQSIMKLSKSSSRSFKCPNCPAEASFEQCKQLFF
ncbi:unnamed protein product [Linum trigynum]|uniref:Uncharacterized protein n=1 Tax=Linum trigynum TaxID=586398 RepID=A0AAV2EW32_9ROSI